MPEPKALKKTLIREGITIALLLLAGLLLVPLSVYFVGTAIFGADSEDGGGAFAARFFAALADGSAAMWFMVTSPLIIWQLLRIAFHGARFRRSR